MTFHDPNRQDKTKAKRIAAAELSTAGTFDLPTPSGDEQSPYVFSFTKGLAHTDRGILQDTVDFELFRDGTEDPNPDIFELAPLNVDSALFHTAKVSDFDTLPGTLHYREWESPTAGHTYDLQGPDAMAVAMPAAPKAGSFEFSAEMAEVYQMALCRDWPVAAFMDKKLTAKLVTTQGTALPTTAVKRLSDVQKDVSAKAAQLSKLKWFKGDVEGRDVADPEQRKRRRFGEQQTASNLFRGMGEDSWETPFLSQFMIMGAQNGERKLVNRASGKIKYGAQQIDQSVDMAVPGKDYMIKWRDWLDVQNALNVRPLVGETEYVQDKGARVRRPMTSLRDMATYVHDDQLYQAYLNAALIMLTEGYSQDPGLPYHNGTTNTAERWNREPFALFGGPHILTLVTEVSTRALKAVRNQKFTIHRRMRPEAAGALFHTIYSGYNPNREHEPKSYKGFEKSGSPEEKRVQHRLGNTLATYTFPKGNGTDPELEKVLEEVRLHNAAKNGEDPNNLNIAKWLLPMAFPEGSPMHPAYGAGHATVAGACVTLLKAMFNMRDNTDDELPAYLVKPKDMALVPDCGVSTSDKTIDLLGLPMAEGLTLEGELNKLIWNVSNARNIGGVHYYTDYIESALLGEAITLGILREQMLIYEPLENVSMTVPLLVPRTLPDTLIHDGPISPKDIVQAVKINNLGQLEAADPTPGR